MIDLTRTTPGARAEGWRKVAEQACGAAERLLKGIDSLCSPPKEAIVPNRETPNHTQPTRSLDLDAARHYLHMSIANVEMRHWLEVIASDLGPFAIPRIDLISSPGWDAPPDTSCIPQATYHSVLPAISELWSAVSARVCRQISIFGTANSPPRLRQNVRFNWDDPQPGTEEALERCLSNARSVMPKIRQRFSLECGRIRDDMMAGTVAYLPTPLPMYPEGTFGQRRAIGRFDFTAIGTESNCPLLDDVVDRPQKIGEQPQNLAEQPQKMDAGVPAPRPVHEKRTIHEQMLAALDDDPRRRDWTAVRWSTELNCSERQVRRTELWKEIQAIRERDRTRRKLT